MSNQAQMKRYQLSQMLYKRNLIIVLSFAFFLGLCSAAPSDPKKADELSTESILEFIDGNFLNKPVPVIPTHQRTGAHSAAQQSASSTDWWNNLGSTGSKPTLQSKPTKRTKNKPVIKRMRPPLYVEQPVNQNPIQTAKLQLIAIRRQHKMLTTRSIEQLVRLEQKLIDGSKICMRRNMPLYGGMLYRTRSYVIKLGRDVKQQRLILESWAQRAQNVIKQNIKNNTLVKEYNRMQRQLAQNHDTKPDVAMYKTSLDDLMSLKQTTTTKSASSSFPIKNSPKNQFDQDPNYYSSYDFKGRLLDSTQTPITTTLALNSIVKSASQKDSNHNQHTKSAALRSISKYHPLRSPRLFNDEEPEIEWVYQAPKLRYSVSVNEINLRKELEKSQELIDKIDRAFRELSDVVDDILFLCKIEAALPSTRRQKLFYTQKGLLTEYRKSIQRFQKHMDLLAPDTIPTESRSPVQNNYLLNDISNPSAAYTQILDDILASSSYKNENNDFPTTSTTSIKLEKER